MKRERERRRERERERGGANIILPFRRRRSRRKGELFKGRSRVTPSEAVSRNWRRFMAEWDDGENSNYASASGDGN